VADEAAGRTGECPKCDAPIVVPMSAPGPALAPGAAEMRVAAVTGGPERSAVDFVPSACEEDRPESSGPQAQIISYGAVGVAWQLLRERLGTWMLTTLVLLLALCGLGLVLQIVTMAGMIVAVKLFGAFGIPIVMVVVAALNIGIQGLVYGGLFRMALKQIDGGEVGVGDVFSLGGQNRVERLVKAIFLMGIFGMLGCTLLVIPGLVVFALSMFTVPLIVDGRMGAWASFKTSLAALRRDWLSAMVFALAMTALECSGILLLGVGVLFTAPWSVLAVAVQYRRSFGPGAKPRAHIVADPHAEAIGIPIDDRRVPRAPILAWVLIGGAVISPAAAAAIILTTLTRAMEASLDAQTERVVNPPRLSAALGPATVRVRPKEPGAAEALSGLRGDKPARLDALRWLSANEPAPGEPLRGEIGTALGALLVAQPGEANLTAHAFARWATFADLPAVAAASWYEHPPGVSGLMKNVVQRLRESAGAEGRKAIDEAVERGRDVARLDAVRIALAEAKSDEAGTRLRAVQRLRKMPVEPQFQDEVVSTMSELIRDHKSKSRTDAVGTIGTWARPGDEKILIAVMEDKNDPLFARPTALEALARNKDPEVIARIVAATSDRAVSTEAARAIRGYGALAEPALLDLLKSDAAQARETACRLLGGVGTERCLPAITKAAKEPNPSVAATARTVLRAVERRLGVEPKTVEKAETPEKSPRKTPSRPSRKRKQPSMPKAGRN
jgi:hypothetical protein